MAFAKLSLNIRLTLACVLCALFAATVVNAQLRTAPLVGSPEQAKGIDRQLEQLNETREELLNEIKSIRKSIQEIRQEMDEIVRDDNEEKSGLMQVLSGKLEALRTKYKDVLGSVAGIFELDQLEKEYGNSRNRRKYIDHFREYLRLLEEDKKLRSLLSALEQERKDLVFERSGLVETCVGCEVPAPSAVDCGDQDKTIRSLTRLLAKCQDEIDAKNRVHQCQIEEITRLKIENERLRRLCEKNESLPRVRAEGGEKNIPTGSEGTPVFAPYRKSESRTPANGGPANAGPASSSSR